MSNLNEVVETRYKFQKSLYAIQQITHPMVATSSELSLAGMKVLFCGEVFGDLTRQDQSLLEEVCRVSVGDHVIPAMEQFMKGRLDKATKALENALSTEDRA